MRGLTLILLTAFILVLALANCQTVTTEGEWITDISNALMRLSYQYIQALLNKRKKGEYKCTMTSTLVISSNASFQLI